MTLMALMPTIALTVDMTFHTTAILTMVIMVFMMYHFTVQTGVILIHIVVLTIPHTMMIMVDAGKLTLITMIFTIQSLMMTMELVGKPIPTITIFIHQIIIISLMGTTILYTVTTGVTVILIVLIDQFITISLTGTTTLTMVAMLSITI